MSVNTPALDDGKYVTMSSVSIVASRATLIAQDIVATSTVSAAAGFAGPGIALGSGTNLSPAIDFTSEQSLGIYRSGTSTIATSYGWFKAPNFISGTTLNASQTTTSLKTQGAITFSVLSLTSNGGEIAFLSGNTVYRFASVSVG